MVVASAGRSSRGQAFRDVSFVSEIGLDESLGNRGAHAISTHSYLVGLCQRNSRDQTGVTRYLLSIYKEQLRIGDFVDDIVCRESLGQIELARDQHA